LIGEIFLIPDKSCFPCGSFYRARKCSSRPEGPLGLGGPEKKTLSKGNQDLPGMIQISPI
jgi:hypothetical protein